MEIWTGLMPFDREIVSGKWVVGNRKPNNMRREWLECLTSEEAWGELLPKTDVIRLYLNTFPGFRVVTAYGQEETLRVTDEQLDALIRFVQKHGKKVAFETGGLRPVEESDVAAGWGRKYAHFEWEIGLERWVRHGGRIDYITTEHAIFSNMEYMLHTPQLPGGSSKRLLRYLISQQAAYFDEMHRLLPQTAFGCFEALRYFEIDPDRYVSDLEWLKISFGEYLEMLLHEMAQYHLTLDHYHYFNDMDSIRADTELNCGTCIGRDGQFAYDFGRIAAVEKLLKQKGIRTGYFLDVGKEAYVNRQMTDHRACRILDAMEQALLDSPLQPDQWLLVNMSPFPQRCGPCTEPDTELWEFNRLAERLTACAEQPAKRMDAV